MRPILIRGGRVIDPSRGTDGVADVYVQDGKIASVGRGIGNPDDALTITLIAGLADDHPARIEGEREIRRLDEIALGSERRGPIQEHEHGLPSYRGPD